MSKSRYYRIKTIKKHPSMHYGDTVKHTDASVNNGHPMTVSSMNEDDTQALCRLDDDSEEWFDVADLTVAEELDDSFI